MSERVSTLDRRQLLGLLGAGVATGLAGCGGDGSTPTATASGTVPAEYETATSIGGVQRDPTALSAQSAVNYQEEPNGEQQCSNCRYYVEDRNADGVGACAVVEGTIAPDAWCVSYAAYQGRTDTTTPVGTGTDTATGTPTDTETPATSLDEPVAVPEDARCPVCEMRSANFPDWNAQAVHEDGTRAFTCTSGCLVTYFVFPDQFAVTDAPVAGVWVSDFETRELVVGSSAHFALETDSDRVDDPMRLNPAAFADRADAEAYVDAVDYLTTEDIVGLDAFDRELVTQYRSRFVEED